MNEYKRDKGILNPECAGNAKVQHVKSSLPSKLPEV
jgi:hypothetical protein